MSYSCVPQMRHKEMAAWIDAQLGTKTPAFTSLDAVPPHEDKHEKARALW